MHVEADSGSCKAAALLLLEGVAAPAAFSGFVREEHLAAQACNALQGLRGLQGHHHQLCDSPEGQDACNALHSIDEALSAAMPCDGDLSCGMAAIRSSHGLYYVNIIDSNLLAAPLQQAAQPLLGQHAVGTGRAAWLLASAPDATEELSSKLHDLAEILTGSLWQDSDQSKPQKLPLSAASEITAVHTLAVEDADAVATWDTQPWHQVLTSPLCVSLMSFIPCGILAWAASEVFAIGCV